MYWILFFILVQTNSIWEHFTLETILGLIGFIAYMVGIWIYYSRKVQAVENAFSSKIKSSISTCQDTCTMKYNAKFETLEGQIMTEKEQRQKTDEKLDSIDEKITDIRLIIKELETVIKTSMNVKAN